MAVWPNPEVLSALAALPRPAMEGLRWSGPDQWHVTLRFFGEVDDRALHAATRALAATAARLPAPAQAVGGPSTRFLGTGLVIWPVEGLGDAAMAVERATKRIGKPPAARRFVGHVTLARAKPNVDLRPTRHLLTPLAISWPIDSLTLVQSSLHPDGARYRVLEEFRMGRQGAGA
ncbi:MAG TPA: 2'-5' RNA ligase family protein [Acidimicrobiales bacterium]|nr:2'-5' RNA ligase family protein [Acidimicrobiales bacterium]